MKKVISIAAIAVSAAFSARAQWIVYDPTSNVQQILDQAENIAKYAQMVDNQVQQIQQLTQQVQQLDKYNQEFGDPSKILNVIGASAVTADLTQTPLGETISAVEKAADGTKALTYDANGLYHDIGASFTTSSGKTVQRNADDYKANEAINNATANYSNVVANVLQRRQTLKDAIAATTKELQSATTASEVQKLTGVLIGQQSALSATDSTQKMGAGTNVQERLIALHHLDAPWRPADVEQREGRILRQGNRNTSVHVFRYVTEGSFDAYMWQTLETKAKFIQQVMTGNTHVRHIEDVDSRALTYAEVKAIASGNPMVIEKASVDAEVMRLQRLRHQHAHMQNRVRSECRKLTERIPDCREFIENLKLDMQQRTDTRGDAFQIQLEKSMVKNRGIAGELLLRVARRVSGEQQHFELGTFAGFALSIRSSQWGAPELILKGKNRYTVGATETPLGMIRSLEYLVQNMEGQLADKQTELANAEKQCEELKGKIGQPFEHETKLQSLVARQIELDEKLDISKNQAGNSLAAEVAEPVSEVLAEDELVSVQNDAQCTPNESRTQKAGAAVRVALAR